MVLVMSTLSQPTRPPMSSPKLVPHICMYKWWFPGLWSLPQWQPNGITRKPLGSSFCLFFHLALSLRPLSRQTNTIKKELGLLKNDKWPCSSGFSCRRRGFRFRPSHVSSSLGWFLVTSLALSIIRRAAHWYLIKSCGGGDKSGVIKLLPLRLVFVIQHPRCRTRGALMTPLSST